MKTRSLLAVSLGLNAILIGLGVVILLRPSAPAPTASNSIIQPSTPAARTTFLPAAPRAESVSPTSPGSPSAGVAATGGSASPLSRFPTSAATTLVQRKTIGSPVTITESNPAGGHSRSSSQPAAAAAPSVVNGSAAPSASAGTLSARIPDQSFDPRAGQRSANVSSGGGGLATPAESAEIPPSASETNVAQSADTNAPERQARAPREETVVTVPDGNVQVPVVLEEAVRQVVDPEQRDSLRTLQNEFVDAIGETSQDPADPAYQERWQVAQVYSDQRFKTLFGYQAYLRAQIEARLRNARQSQ